MKKIARKKALRFLEILEKNLSDYNGPKWYGALLEFGFGIVSLLFVFRLARWA